MSKTATRKLREAAARRPENIAPICPYCGTQSVFHASSEAIYGGRNFGPYYGCPRPDCDAHVGCHRATLQPLGRLANKELRRLKIETHAHFDPLHRRLEEAYPEVTVFPKWMHQQARARAYALLADLMGIDPAQCHIAMFDEFQCRVAIHFITSRQLDAVKVRAWAKARAP